MKVAGLTARWTSIAGETAVTVGAAHRAVAGSALILHEQRSRHNISLPDAWSQKIPEQAISRPMAEFDADDQRAKRRGSISHNRHCVTDENNCVFFHFIDRNEDDAAATGKLESIGDRSNALRHAVRLATERRNGKGVGCRPALSVKKKRRSLPAPPSRRPLEEENLARRVAAGVGPGPERPPRGAGPGWTAAGWRSRRRRAGRGIRRSCRG